MAIFAARQIFDMFFGVLLLVKFTVDTLTQKAFHFFVGKFSFAGRLDDMALRQAIHLFNVFMWNFFYIRMAPLTFDFGVDAHGKCRFIDEQQSECTVFIDSAKTRILMAQQAIANIGRQAVGKLNLKKQAKSQTAVQEKMITFLFGHMDPTARAIDNGGSATFYVVGLDYKTFTKGKVQQRTCQQSGRCYPHMV